ncbi:hypothetical protein BaRGS_00015127, partial [Batillaria attramentaria]
DGKNYMQEGIVSVDGQDVYTFCDSQSCIDNPHIITISPPLSGRIVKLTRPSNNYLAICELQVEGCETGWWGDKCDRECPAQCDGPCDAGDGHCSTCVGQFAPPLCTECVPGWYGDQCDRECGQHCLPDNNGNKTCGRTNGHCTLECVPGWYGDQCDRECGQHCLPDNNGNKTCGRTNGHCTLACQPGWYSEQCDKQCSEYCLPDDNGNTTCVQTNGHCTLDCVQGWYQQNCTEPCGENCDGGCDRDTGVCNGCRPGYYGTQCQAPCGNGCINKTCNRQNGECSCESTWSPPYCTECKNGYYGITSCEPCGHCNTSNACDKNNGHCPGGCVDGFVGDLCDSQQTAPGESSGSDAGVIAGGVVGAVVGIAAVTALVVFIVFRRRRSSKGSGTKDVDVAADHAHSDTLSPSQSPGMSADPSSTAAKVKVVSTAKKPKAQIKPFNHSETTDKEAGGPAGHIYSNTAAVANLTAPETSSQSATGGNAASTSTGAGQVYENVPMPQGRGQTEKPPEPFPRTEDLYGSFKSLSSAQLDAFQRYLLACLGSGELGDQFENLPKGMRHPHTIGLSEENKRKNRFKALCTYDFNRVVLRRPSGDNSSDYINATYIKGCQGDQQYIATQGPRANTIDDLWWMVWQEGITQIVMLANLQEDGKDKCEEYWPASGKSQTHGHMTVRGLEVRQRADFVTRSFLLKNNTTSEERHVTQYHYMAWPDHGVPLAASLVDYWRYVKGRTTSTVPLLVHCSAGVGRTGTFIALDIASEKESRGDDVNVNEIVTQLREQRALMVQSEAQYKFLHEVILEAHTSRATRMLKYMGQFAAKPKHTMATMPENRDKNRNMDALPDDDYVVYLSAHVRGRNQYINAVYMSSFHHRHGFILTQMPIPSNTLIDFWRLVDGCHVTRIVSLGSDKEEETVENYCRYWPHAGETSNAGPYSITTNSATKQGPALTSFRLAFTSPNNDRPREVELLHYKNWAGEVPGDTSSLLQLVDTVKAKQTDDVTTPAKGVKPNETTTPIIVQCIDGAAKSGLFCALCDVISRVTYDDEVDVYLTAREVQRIRPQAVATQTQYRYLYHVAQEYIRHVGVYANSGVK